VSMKVDVLERLHERIGRAQGAAGVTAAPIRAPPPLRTGWPLRL
jgi:hypothetical protein